MTFIRSLRADSTLYVFATIVLLLVGSGLFFGVLVQTAADTPATFSVVDLEPGNETVDETETVTVAATVENTGDAEATKIVDISIEDRTESASVTLGPGESETVELDTLTAGSLGIGNATHSVRTEDDERTATVAVESDRPPLFEILEFEPTEVNTTETPSIDPSALVENTGGAADNQTVRLQIDGETVSESTLSLGPGESEQFTVYNLGLDSLDPGEHTYQITTANETASGTITVPEPVQFELSAFKPGDVTVADDDEFQVSATVENTGELVGDREVEFQVDDETRQTEHITLAGGESTAVEFTVEAGDIGAGTYRHGLSTGDDTTTGELVVEGEEPPRYEVTEFEPGDTTVEDTLSVSATVENTGEQTGDETVELRVDGTVRGSESLELSPGESTEFRLFNLSFETLGPGEYEYGVVTPSDSETAILVIE